MRLTPTPWAEVLVCAVLLAWAGAVHADELIGKVVKIADGDTLTVLDAGNRQHKIRLLYIDAPEKKQPFGQRSKQSLSAMCFGKSASVVWTQKDRYGRTLGHVTCAGVDANTEQVRRGMAWVYVKYAPKDSPLYRLEQEARRGHRGLWSDPKPVPPWHWREQRRRKR